MIDMNKLANELSVLCGLLGFEISVIRKLGDAEDIEVSTPNHTYFYTIYYPNKWYEIKVDSYVHDINKTFTLTPRYSNHRRILQHATLVLTERRKELNNESK